MRLIIVTLFLVSAPSIFANEGGFGPWVDEEYEPRGSWTTIDDLDMYVAQRGHQGTGDKFVVWAHDIYGYNSGRTMSLVDQLASETEYTVVLPNFFRNETLPLTDYTLHEWDTSLQDDWYFKITPFLEVNRAHSVGVVGTCWGAYFVTHVSAADMDTAPFKVNAGFSVHPYHVEVMADLGESESAVYADIEANKVPQYFGPTPSETDNVRPGGLADLSLTRDYYETFLTPCYHGFFNRGDLSYPAIDECFQRAYGNMTDLFLLYL